MRSKAYHLLNAATQKPIISHDLVFNERAMHPNLDTNTTNKDTKPTLTMETQLTKHVFIEDVATLALGLQPRQKGLKGVGQEECENENSHSQVSSPFGSWSPGGLPNLHRAIAKVKTPRIEEFFISLENY
jgi:hypothetical protein